VLLEAFHGSVDHDLPNDSYGRHPLHIAIVNNADVQSIELLLKHFPYAVNTVDSMSGKLPIELAAEAKYERARRAKEGERSGSQEGERRGPRES
jgi:hypothetical protein